MKIKDLPLLSVLGDAFKIPISDITSDRALAVTLGQILAYVKSQTIDDRYHTTLLEETPYEALTADDMEELRFYCEMEALENTTVSLSGNTVTVSGGVTLTGNSITVSGATFNNNTITL